MKVTQDEFDSGTLENGKKIPHLTPCEIIGDGYVNKQQYCLSVVDESAPVYIQPEDFIDRFLFEEIVLVVANANPAVKAFYDDARFRKRPMNLKSPKLRKAMDLLLAEKIIKAGRDLVLLAHEQH